MDKQEAAGGYKEGREKRGRQNCGTVRKSEKGMI